MRSLAAVRPLFLSGLLAALCLVPPPSATAAPPADVTVVQAPAAPPGGTIDLSFRELWRAGSGDDEDLLLGRITRVLPTADGGIYAADSEFFRVLVFGPDGSLLRTIGHEGDGPGEVRSIGDLIALPDGNLGIVQIFPGKIVTLDPLGNPAPPFVPGGATAAGNGFGVLVRGKCRDGRVGLTGIAQTFAQGQLSQTRFLAVFAADGSPLDTLVTKHTTMAFTAPVLDEKETDFCWERWDFLPDGGVVVNPPRDAFRLEFYGPDGILRRIVVKDEQPLPRDEEELAFNRSMLEAQGRHYPSPPKIVVAETAEMVEGVTVRDDGEIWVLTARGRLTAPPGVLATYDVFDTEGHYLRRVAVHGEGNPRDDRIFLLDGNRIALVSGLRSAALGAAGGESEDIDEEDAEASFLALIVGELVP